METCRHDIRICMNLTDVFEWEETYYKHKMATCCVNLILHVVRGIDWAHRSFISLCQFSLIHTLTIFIIFCVCKIHFYVCTNTHLFTWLVDCVLCPEMELWRNLERDWCVSACAMFECMWYVFISMCLDKEVLPRCKVFAVMSSALHSSLSIFSALFSRPHLTYALQVIP